MSKTVNICKLKIDNKGRITLPNTFLKANGVKVGSHVVVQPMYNSNSIKIKFEDKEKKNDSNR